jgi:hypothetical protein
MLKPEIIQTVVPTIIGEIKTELISELKSVIKSAVIQAIEDAIKPLQDCINKQNDKITSLKGPCVLKVTCLSLPGFGTFRVTDCERCRLEGGFICSSEPDKGRLREKLLVYFFCVFSIEIEYKCY